MTPLFFGESSSPLYGVYHPPAKASFQESAFLICSPIGHEYTRTYSAIKNLAQSLATEGAHVLRFSYTGLGDSALDSDNFSVRQALQDIQLAMDELRDMSALKIISIVGVRYGALLAIEITRHHNIEKLILWEPVLSGKKYLEDTILLHKKMLADHSRFDMKNIGIQYSSGQLLGHPYSLQEQENMANFSAGNMSKMKAKSVTIHTSNPGDNNIEIFSRLVNLDGTRKLDVNDNNDDGEWQSLEVENVYFPNQSISNIVDKAI